MSMHLSKWTVSVVSGVLVLAFMPISPVLAQSEPAQHILSTVREGLAVLQDPELQGDDLSEVRIQRLFVVLEPIFDFPEISRRALGRHWLQMSGAQQEEFVTIFTQMLKDVYISKSDTYRGKKIEFVRELQKGKKIKVQTSFILVDDKTLAVDFIVHQTSSGWKIYDILIEGVSTVGNYRTQFNSLLTGSSVEAMLEELRDKQGS